MPSILRTSSAFGSNKIALVSQGLSEESSGLVTVNVAYAATEDNNDYWSSRFTLDSQPPIFPDIVTKANLQQGALHLGARSASKQNGIVEINATYYGALRSALAATNKKTSITQLSASTQILFNGFEFYIRANFKSQVWDYEIATIGASAYSPRGPSISGLFIGFTSIDYTIINRITFGGTPSSTTSTNSTMTLEEAAFSGLLSSGSLVLSREQSQEVYAPSVSVSTTRYTIAVQGGR